MANPAKTRCRSLTCVLYSWVHRAAAPLLTQAWQRPVPEGYCTLVPHFLCGSLFRGQLGGHWFPLAQETVRHPPGSLRVWKVRPWTRL